MFLLFSILKKSLTNAPFIIIIAKKRQKVRKHYFTIGRTCSNLIGSQFFVYVVPLRSLLKELRPFILHLFSSFNFTPLTYLPGHSTVGPRSGFYPFEPESLSHLHSEFLLMPSEFHPFIRSGSFLLKCPALFSFLVLFSTEEDDSTADPGRDWLNPKNLLKSPSCHFDGRRWLSSSIDSHHHRHHHYRHCAVNNDDATVGIILFGPLIESYRLLGPVKPKMLPQGLFLIISLWNDAREISMPYLLKKSTLLVLRLARIALPIPDLAQDHMSFHGLTLYSILYLIYSYN